MGCPLSRPRGRPRRAGKPLRSASIGRAPSPDPQARERNVLITHDTRCALDAVVDLVNTAPEDGAADGLADVPSLADFVRKHEISDVGVLSERDLAAVQDIRGRFAGIFAADDPRDAASLINELVAAAGDHASSDGPRRLRLACPLLRARRLGRRPPRGGLRDGAGLLRRRRGAGTAAPLRGSGLPTGLRRSVPQSLPPLLRQPHLREPASRRRLPGAPQGSRGLIRSGQTSVRAGPVPGYRPTLRRGRTDGALGG